MFTQYADDLKGTFDHIMYAWDESSVQLELLELLDVPTKEVLAKEVAIPSSLFPSDHIRMEALFYVYSVPRTKL
jgi:mRNA deadenylase 3'-5' endonuclease subunit Ccr4